MNKKEIICVQAFYPFTLKSKFESTGTGICVETEFCSEQIELGINSDKV